MRPLLALLLFLTLPACATISAVTSLSVPQKDVAAAVVAFDGAQDTATTYLLRPTCQPGQNALASACKTRAGVLLLKKDMPAGRKARNDLWTASKSATAGVGARALLTAVIDATSALTADIKN